MCSLQKMLDGKFAPVRPHPDDIVECSDGSECARRDAFVDCHGGYHRTDEERFDTDVQIVADLLDERGKWADEYCTENGDYADGYSYIVNERRFDWDDRVEDWIRDQYGDFGGYVPFEDCIGEVVAMVCNELDADFDCEPEYHPSDYAAYSGEGCCLDSFDIGEYEDQVDIDAYPELKHLHDKGELDDVLDYVRCDVYVGRSRRREKNEKTGHYEYVGRETYMPYENSRVHPCFEIYVQISGQWQFVVPADRMSELVSEALLEHHGYEDCDD